MKSPRGRRVLDRQDRYKARTALGPLRELLMTVNAKRRYEAALSRYFAYEETLEADDSADAIDFDARLSTFVEQLWQEGDPRYWAEDTLSAISKWIPSLRGQLRMSWSLVSAWQRNEPPQRCTPLSLDILLAMVGRAIALDWLRMSLVLLIGFHCLLRTAEMYKLRANDFEFNATLTAGVLTIRESKSGTRYNIVESVTITDPTLICMFKAVTLHLQPGELLFPEGPNCFRKRFDQLVMDLCLPSSLLYKPYSIRRGAATADFLAHGKLSRTCVRGRWANEKTCRIYINEASSTLASLRFSNSTAAQIKRLKDKALKILA